MLLRLLRVGALDVVVELRLLLLYGGAQLLEAVHDLGQVPTLKHFTLQGLTGRGVSYQIQQVTRNARHVVVEVELGAVGGFDLLDVRHCDPPLVALLVGDLQEELPLRGLVTHELEL